MGAGGGQRLGVVQGLSPWPAGRGPVRRTRPPTPRAGPYRPWREVQAAGGVGTTVDHSDMRGLVAT